MLLQRELRLDEVTYQAQVLCHSFVLGLQAHCGHVVQKLLKILISSIYTHVRVNNMYFIDCGTFSLTEYSLTLSMRTLTLFMTLQLLFGPYLSRR